MTMTHKWIYEAVLDCTGEDGTAFQWTARDPRGNVWIIDLEKYKDGDVYSCMTWLAWGLETCYTCKSIISAKRWITKNWMNYTDES